MQSSSNQKIVTVSFVAAGILTWLVAQVFVEIAAASFGIVSRYADQTWVRHGIPLLAGSVVFAIFQFSRAYQVWGDEVVSELKKVVFPTQKETVGATVVVVIMLMIASFVLAAFDFLSSQFMQLFIN